MNIGAELPPASSHPHWSDAAYHWRHYGSPLRPCAADIAAMEALIDRARASHRARPLKAILLGVTPEIATMAWPEGTELVAVDRSPAMIGHVWPGDVTGRRRAICADWFDFTWRAEAHDVVIGDGIFSILDFPRQHLALAASIRESLAPDGVFVTRLFVQPARSESPEAVFADLRANRIGSFNAFKLRLAMALQPTASAGVRMGDIYDAWNSAGIDAQVLAAMTGWSREEIETIRPWKGKDSRLVFPGATEWDIAMSEFFVKHDERVPAYELGERCPIMSYRARR